MILTCFLLLLAGFCDGRMDDIQFHYSQTLESKLPWQQWLNPSLSWRNKYKFKWVPVQLTDYWHFLKEIMLLSLSFSAGLHTNFYHPILDSLAIRLLFFLGFYPAYRFFKTTK